MAAWDKIEGETLRAYTAFKEYIMMGNTRSINKIAPIVKINRNTIAQWSMRNHWQIRAVKYEEYLLDSYIEKTKAMSTAGKERIVQDSLQDYEDMLEAWRENWNQMLIDPEGFSPTRMQIMISARKTIEDMGRRAVNLPHVIREETSGSGGVKTVPNGSPLMILGSATKRYDKPIEEDFDE